MKKIALISDIHGNLPALEAVVDDIKKKNVDEIINLGDHISGPLWPKETTQYLMNTNWIHVSGNHDRNLIYQNPEKMGQSDKFAYPFLEQPEKDWLQQQPNKLVTTDGFFLFHGNPFNGEPYLLETVENGNTRIATHSEIISRLGEHLSNIILSGHSHIQRVVEIPGHSLLINPGSVGLPAYDDDFPEYHVIEAGSPHARYAIIEFNEIIKSIEMISVTYDYHLAVKQATQNNRPDWAHALETGSFI